MAENILPDPKNWIPTPENINALPEPLRGYIHDLATRCDPAGEIAELALTKDQNRQMQALVDQSATSLHTAADLIAILEKHCGERGQSEGAVETLTRIIAERATAEAACKTAVQETLRKLIGIWEARATQYAKRAGSFGMKRDKLYAGCYREMADIIRKSFGIVEVTNGSGH